MPWCSSSRYLPLGTPCGHPCGFYAPVMADQCHPGGNPGACTTPKLSRPPPPYPSPESFPKPPPAGLPVWYRCNELPRVGLRSGRPARRECRFSQPPRRIIAVEESSPRPGGRSLDSAALEAPHRAVGPATWAFLESANAPGRAPSAQRPLAALPAAPHADLTLATELGWPGCRLQGSALGLRRGPCPPSHPLGHQPSGDSPKSPWWDPAASLAAEVTWGALRRDRCRAAR